MKEHKDIEDYIANLLSSRLTYTRAEAQNAVALTYRERYTHIEYLSTLTPGDN